LTGRQREILTDVGESIREKIEKRQRERDCDTEIELLVIRQYGKKIYRKKCKN
jgi:hypothetical protein